jgi:putative glutamine amidotransferase
MPRPLVGITTYHRDGSDRPRFSLPSAYVDAVRAGGGVPVLLPPGEKRFDDLVDDLDGLVLAGGGDIHPERFGADRHALSYSVCNERDDFEFELARAALARELPTLAICRGLQVLNVLLGGELHVHLPDAVGETVPHRDSQQKHTYHHVRLDPDSHLAQVYGAAELEVASWHHQAVSRLGGALRACAWAEDGTVEAVELPGAPWLLAVQWHPEISIEAGSPHRRVFEALVEVAQRRP